MPIERYDIVSARHSLKKKLFYQVHDMLYLHQLTYSSVAARLGRSNQEIAQILDNPDKITLDFLSDIALLCGAATEWKIENNSLPEGEG